MSLTERLKASRMMLNSYLELESADGIACRCVQAALLLLNRLTAEMIRYDMQLALAKLKVLFQDWEVPVPAV